MRRNDFFGQKAKRMVSACAKDGQGRRHLGFTLMELLVVISIIALLMSILMPSLSRVRESAKRTVCMSRIKNLLNGVIMYSSSWDYRMPTWDHTIRPELGWHIAAQTQLAYSYKKVQLGKLYPGYLDNGKIYFCPSARQIGSTFKTAYSYNFAGEADFYYGMKDPASVPGSTNGTYHLRGDLKIGDLTQNSYEKNLINHPRRIIITDTALYWNGWFGDDHIIEKVRELVNHLNSKGQPDYYSCGWVDGSVTGYKVKNPDSYLGDTWPYNTTSQEYGASVMDVMARDGW